MPIGDYVMMDLGLWQIAGSHAMLVINALMFMINALLGQMTNVMLQVIGMIG